MKRFRCSCSLWGRLRGGVVAAALASLLAACGGPGNNEPSATPEPVAGPAANTTTPTPSAQPAEGQSYPNLGTVPQAAPATTSSADRQQVTAGLVADNQNAAYSDQPVTAAQQTGTPVAAPLPAPVPAPAAPATSTTTPTATASTTTGSDTGSVTATPLAPPAASVTVGQTVTNQPTTQQTASTAAPAATVAPTPAMTPPSTMGTATPMAPPPNPVPPAPAMVSTSPGVSVDASQLSGSPLPGYQPVPTYSSGPLATISGSAPAYALPMGAAPVAGQPVAVIFFTESSSAISDRAQWVLRNVYLLQQQQGGRLRLVGNASLHTVTMDPQRHDQVNYRISQARANAVARTLISMGVPQGSIGVSAQGSQAPIFYEFMPTGEAANRRVEIYLDR
jgi:outer membrane protein OmpA-like peptidoglycan-associated protein